MKTYLERNVFHQTGGSALFQNCTFDQNQLTGNSEFGSYDLKGGVYYMKDNAKVFLEGCSLDSNALKLQYASTSGGVFYVESGTVTAENTTFDHNTIETMGGYETKGGIFILKVER